MKKLEKKNSKEQVVKKGGKKISRKFEKKITTGKIALIIFENTNNHLNNLKTT